MYRVSSQDSTGSDYRSLLSISVEFCELTLYMTVDPISIDLISDSLLVIQFFPSLIGDFLVILKEARIGLIKGIHGPYIC